MAKPDKKEEINIVRIMGTGINGKYSLLHGLAQIKGIGLIFSNAVCVSLKMDKSKKISDLSEKEIEVIEEFLYSDKKEGIPTWLMNKQKDLETGEDKHNTGKDLEYDQMQVKRRLFKQKSYRGIRLKERLPLRGQRTKSNFRRNKTLAAMKAKTGGKK
jgi:small subunit ribosomal protein S13